MKNPSFYDVFEEMWKCVLRKLNNYVGNADNINIGVLAMEHGGTNANNGADGLANLFAAGETVLSSYQYGNTLPQPGIPGRIFFKKVSEQ
jgi:hypothetical protein